jgi:uncharacterized protein YcbX
VIEVVSLHVYPVKSCGAVDVDRLVLDERGAQFDRHWMVVDGEGSALTQRQTPSLALVRPTFEAEALRLTAPGMPLLSLPLTLPDAPRATVEVWEFKGDAVLESAEAAQWFSDLLGTACRLVRMAPDVVRPVNPRYALRSDHVSFTDGFPLLLASVESLADLNAWLDVPVVMNRFRPNIVVAGGRAYEEDEWRAVRAATVRLDLVKPCARCKTTTVDQTSGAVGKEPLATLTKYRRTERGVLFGQNCLHDGPGHIDVGTPIEVLERADPAARLEST